MRVRLSAEFIVQVTCSTYHHSHHGSTLIISKTVSLLDLHKRQSTGSTCYLPHCRWLSCGCLDSDLVFTLFVSEVCPSVDDYLHQVKYWSVSTRTGNATQDDYVAPGCGPWKPIFSRSTTDTTQRGDMTTIDSDRATCGSGYAPVWASFKQTIWTEISIGQHFA